VAVNSVTNGQVTASEATIDFRALMNPALIGVVSLSVPTAIWLAWKQHSRLALWTVVWIVANYLPFFALTIVSHRISYLYYILPTIPAFAVAAALLLVKAGLPRFVTWAYLAASVAAFVAYFPFRQVP
jgi:hypothetical protein